MNKLEEILKNEFEPGVWDELMFYLRTEISPSIFNAMKKYATECAEASLERASIEVALYHNESRECKKAITNPDNIVLL